MEFAYESRNGSFDVMALKHVKKFQDYSIQKVKYDSIYLDYEPGTMTCFS